MFFIFGSPRSGTTLLAQSLSAHSDIIVPAETDFVIPLAFIVETVRDPEIGKQLMINLITHSSAFPQHIGEYLDKNEVSNIIMGCEYHPTHILNALYGGLATKLGKKLAGNKTPNDIMYLRILDQAGTFDDQSIKIIHVVRDVRDVMVSLQRANWVSDLDLYFPRLWCHSNLYLYSLYQHKTASYSFIRYEDMVREPERIFRSLCDFLGFEFEPGMLDFHNFHPRYHSMSIHAKLYTPISTNNIGSYMQGLDASVIHSFEKQAKEALETFGYDME